MALTWRGPWQTATSYVVDDIVSWDGSSWIAVQNSTGQTPDSLGSAFWQVLAQSGDTLVKRLGDVLDVDTTGLSNGDVLVYSGGRWYAQTPSTYGLTDAPTDGKDYVRRNGSWTEITVTGLTDAASNGKTYARKNGGWVEVESATLTDVANDGIYYTRRNGAWTALPNATTTQTGLVRIGTGLTVTDGVVSITNRLRTFSTAADVLTATDAMGIVVSLGSSAATLTVPGESTVNYDIGTTITLIQGGSGQVTLAPASGVTLNGTPGLKVSAQYGRVVLTKWASNAWVAAGDLSA